ncbi:Mycoredoxin 1 [Corynebacterium capitovis DSM 44611]|uniref:mycoredoxin n=1 Tax=Corynebacterium capitovis TaxID=131081 RepID=UPI00036149CD|nr:mycoredoxin [Corynebacterium capitovis]WKD58062.1 Mycoredoxin 1 [Corynebacterium capitovis DSM 44611]
MTIYATSWCPFCRSLLSALENTGLDYEVVDVEAPGNDEAAAWVESVNGGNRVVPTVRYSDGTHATNPSLAQVMAKYEELNR